jgi:hypothetical protein
VNDYSSGRDFEFDDSEFPTLQSIAAPAKSEASRAGQRAFTENENFAPVTNTTNSSRLLQQRPSTSTTAQPTEFSAARASASRRHTSVDLPPAPAPSTGWAAAAAAAAEAVSHPFSRPTLARLLGPNSARGSASEAHLGGLPAAFAPSNFRRPGLLDMATVAPGEAAEASATLTNAGARPVELWEALLLPGGAGPFVWGDMPRLPLVLGPGECGRSGA